MGNMAACRQLIDLALFGWTYEQLINDLDVACDTMSKGPEDHVMGVGHEVYTSKHFFDLLYFF